MCIDKTREKSAKYLGAAVVTRKLMDIWLEETVDERFSFDPMIEQMAKEILDKLFILENYNLHRHRVTKAGF
jgi:hypothetical protein